MKSLSFFFVCVCVFRFVLCVCVCVRACVCVVVVVVVGGWVVVVVSFFLSFFFPSFSVFFCVFFFCCFFFLRVFLSFFPQLSLSLLYGENSLSAPPSQVSACVSLSLSLTKSTVASAPGDALRGTGARPRGRTARYTACCGATGHCTPRRGSRPEKWPPSPEL